MAYVGKADAYHEWAFHFDESVRDLFLKAKEAALKAIEINESLGEAYASLGFINLRYEWDWEGAEKYLKRALELNPNHALSHRKYASFLRAVGRVDESLLEIKEALKLDPLSPKINA